MAAYTDSTSVGLLLGMTFGAATSPTQAQVNSIIARVQSYIDSTTGRIWTTATTSEYFDTFDDARLSIAFVTYYPAEVQTTFFLKNRPVVSIDSLQHNTGGLSSQNWVSLATGYGGDAIFWGDEGYIQFHRTLPLSGRKNVKVAYTYGISPTPNDIKYCAELLSAADILTEIKRGSDQEGLKSIRVGNVAYDFGDIDRQEKSFRALATDILRQRGMTWDVNVR